MPTDPRGLRSDAPLLDAWLRFQEAAPTPFTIPGHKQRRDLVGDVVAGDVPLYAGLDTMKLSGGVLVEAEARAARLWGADLCRFSVGGATHLNQAPMASRGRNELDLSELSHRDRVGVRLTNRFISYDPGTVTPRRVGRRADSYGVTEAGAHVGADAGDGG